MYNTAFYHGTIRNTVVAFGNLWNGMQVRRFNQDGSILQSIDVPLSYSGREKWVQHLTGNPDLLKSTSITLPRMAFEVLGFKYDAARKLNSLNMVSKPISGSSNAATARMPVPYNIDFALYVAAKTIEDSLQMVEQILPYFAPHYNMTVNSIPELGLVEDVPVILNTTDNDDNYMAEWIEERIIVNTFRFTAKVNLYGPVSNSAVIKKTNVTVHTNIQGNPITGEHYYAAVNPLTANKTDVYTIDSLWSDI